MCCKEIILDYIDHNVTWRRVGTGRDVMLRLNLRVGWIEVKVENIFHYRKVKIEVKVGVEN